MTFLWLVDVTLSERLTRHFLCWRCGVLSCALISRHVARSYGWGWMSLALQANILTFENARSRHCSITFRILYTVHRPYDFYDSCVLLPSESSCLSILPTQRYSFSTPIALTLHCIDLITAWDCLFSGISYVLLLSFAFLRSPFFSGFLAWVGVFLGFISPFSP